MRSDVTVYRRHVGNGKEEKAVGWNKIEDIQPPVYIFLFTQTLTVLDGLNNKLLRSHFIDMAGKLAVTMVSCMSRKFRFVKMTSI